MAQRKPEERVSLDKVLKLADKLSPEEQKRLRYTLNAKAWGETWDTVLQEIRKQNKDLAPLSEEQIFAEWNAIKKELRTERAQGNN